jgi:hypothetical protein
MVDALLAIARSCRQLRDFAVAFALSEQELRTLDGEASCSVRRLT